MLKQEFILQGLSCAGCAAKIEAEANNLPGVKQATVDFVSRRLRCETAEDVAGAEIHEQITEIVRRIEPDVKIIYKPGDTQTKAQGGTFQENKEKRRREMIKLVAGGVIFLIGIIADWEPWLELTLFLLSYLIVGGSVLLRSLKDIFRGEVFSEYFLMGIASMGAFLIGEYPEGVAVMLFYQVGELFQDMAVDHSRQSISSLMNIRPDYANLETAEGLLKVAPEEVNAGDIIVVKTGERIPLDGEVIEGESLVDTSALTGESVPRQLSPGMEALSGFINKNGVLKIKVTKKHGESTVARILDLVQNAGSRKAPTEKFISKFARYYTPVVVFVALALAVIPPLVIPGATFTTWIYRALVFLVVSCPCALVISIPLGFFGGIGGASKKGILVKGGNYLEALTNVETVVLDKTGTLTKGEFKVTEINPQNGFTKAGLLEYAAYAECYSNYPLALSVLNAYPEEIVRDRITGYEEIAGEGIRVKFDGQELLVGNSKLMDAAQIEYAAVESIGTVIHVAVDREYAGNIVVDDEVKEDAVQAIRELKKLGIKQIVMLTGDIAPVGEKIGRELGLDQVYAELLPADKVEKLEMLDSRKSRQGKIVYVGDGINDAPVLARADIGISMGALGSDAAIEAADIVIMTDEPSKIATAIRIARKTRAVVMQNIALAFGVKTIVLFLGAFGLVSMWGAVFADVGVALLAIFNALRIINTRNI